MAASERISFSTLSIGHKNKVVISEASSAVALIFVKREAIVTRTKASKLLMIIC